MPSCGRTDSAPVTVSGASCSSVHRSSPLTSTVRPATSWWVLAMDNRRSKVQDVPAGAPAGPSVPANVSENHR